MFLQTDEILPASAQAYHDQLPHASLIILVVKAFYQGPLQTHFRHPLTHAAQIHAHNTKKIHSAKR